MPRLSVWLVRSALVYLALGFTFGGLLLFNKGVPLGAWVWRLLPAHIEFVLMGWTLQLASGIAFWILPRFLRGPARGNERLAQAACVALNAGVLLAGLGPVFNSPGWVLFAGRVLELSAVALLAINFWPRVKPAGL